MDTSASKLLQESLKSLYGTQVSGCVFLVCRNGEPYADGSFGFARRLDAPDGALEMSIDTQVHVASISKFICAAGILRLIQETQQIFSRTAFVNGERRYTGPLTTESRRLISNVMKLDMALSLDTKVYQILEPYLDQSLISRYTDNYPGEGVRDVTIRQLLQHKSGLPTSINEDDLAGEPVSNVSSEPPDGSAAFANIFKEVTGLFRRGANFGEQYNNAGYTVLGAVIEAMTGKQLGVWLHSRFFSQAEFSSISRKITDPANAARYYVRENDQFLIGNYHPDYSNFSAKNGWYVSARQFCKWVDCLMNSNHILDNPDLLVSERLGFDGEYGLSRFYGASKNGRDWPGGGHTRARFVYLKGLGDERICAFVMANTNFDDTDRMLDDGLRVLRVLLNRRPSSVPAIANIPMIPNVFPTDGLRQSVYWTEGKELKSAGKYMPLTASNVAINGPHRSRTNILGGSTNLAGGKTKDDKIYVESRGFLKFPEKGIYRFRLSSDDGSMLWLEHQLIIDNDGNHSLRSVESDELHIHEPGLYPIVIEWFNNFGSGQLYLEWKTPNQADYGRVEPNLFFPF